MGGGVGAGVGGGGGVVVGDGLGDGCGVGVVGLGAGLPGAGFGDGVTGLGVGEELPPPSDGDGLVVSLGSCGALGLFGVFVLTSGGTGETFLLLLIRSNVLGAINKPPTKIPAKSAPLMSNVTATSFFKIMTLQTPQSECDEQALL